MNAMVLDREQLQERCLDDIDFMRQMLHIFLQHGPATLHSLRESLAANNLNEATRYAHSLKGSAANLAAEDMRVVAWAAEQDGRNNDSSALSARLPLLEHEMARCINAIQQLLTELK